MMIVVLTMIWPTHLKINASKRLLARPPPITAQNVLKILIVQPLQTLEDSYAIQVQAYVMAVPVWVLVLALKMTLPRRQSALVRLANVPLVLNVLLQKVYVIPMYANHAQGLTAVHANLVIFVMVLMLANVLVVLQHVQEEMFVIKVLQTYLLMPVEHALRMLTVK